jgi:murein DD-endopeptidase MepM/ murein hydrolase activator NlpD
LFVNEIRGNSDHNTFGYVRKYPDGTPKPHQGWDFEAKVGEPIYAIAAGKVEFVSNHGDYGLQLCHSFVWNDQTLYAFYAHLASVRVTQGQTIQMDDWIATSGKSGNAFNLPESELHLHFEVRTIKSPGLGLTGRVSPIKVFRKCPLNSPVLGF